MKLSCLQERLSRGLGIVGRAVATRPTLPITGNVLLSTDGGRLKLAATNLEVAISSWVGAEIEEEGAITIPARLLTDFINTLPNDRVDISLLPRASVLELRCARYEARISGMDVEDFPPIPTPTPGLEARLDPEELRAAISRVAFAAATEETRPVLTGVQAEFEGDTITFAAADGFRLAVYKAPSLSPVAEREVVIIPARTLGELSRLVASEEEPVELVINPQRSQMLVRLKDIELVSQLIQGTFPNYSQLIPQSYGTRAVVDASEFLRATRTASIFARDGSSIIRLQITPGEGGMAGRVTISARAEEVGDNIGEIDAIVDGDEAKIAFNSRYLTDVLSVLHGGNVALEITSPSSPGVIRPTASDNYVHVVMPMFVQW